MPRPSDIAVVLTNTQDLIDQAINIVTETTKTQGILEKNILITDKKIDIHDKDEEAHDDIRQQLAAMSRTMLSEPDISGPKYIETGTEGTWILTANALISSVKITGYKVIDKQGNTFEVKADPHGVGTFVHTFEGERNEETYFTVTAQGSYSSQSPSVQFDFTITQHLPPDLTELEIESPSVVSYGKTYDLTISGFQDLDDDFTDYSIESDHPEQIIISKTEGIGDGETISFTVAEDLQGGELFFTITAHDAWGLESKKTLAGIRINQDPEIVALTHTYPNNLTIGKSILARVSGIVDPDDDEVTYDISCSLEGITFSKQKDIALNEDITVTTTEECVEGEEYTLTFTFKDPYGGSVTHTITSKINTPPNMSGFKCEQDEYHVPGRTTDISFSGVEDEDGETIIYSINNTNPNITFSKTVDIAEDEKISITFAEDSVRGQTYSFTVTATDLSGGSSTVTVMSTVNKVISPEDIETDIPDVIIPNTIYDIEVGPLKDADDHTLTYTITADNEDFTISHVQDGMFTVLTALIDLERGDEVEFTITANDGYEDVSTKVKAVINQLPVSTDIAVVGIPEDFKGGTENQAEFTITGAIDPDDQEVRYSITDISEGLTISQTEDILSSDTVTITAEKVEEETTLSFTVTPYDELDEEGDPVVIEVVVHPILVTKAPTITNPLNKSDPMIMPHYEGWTMTWSEYEEMVDTDMEHTVYPWNEDVPWTSALNE